MGDNNNYHLEELISQDEIISGIKKLGKKIEKDYENQDLYCVGILKGASIFMAELIQHINNDNLSIDFLSVSSYGSETKSRGVVKIIKDLDVSLEGKNVLIIEDIIDSGITLSYLKNYFLVQKPKSIKICTLLDKPTRRTKDISVDYSVFTIEDFFVVGFGLDYAEKFRQLPYIAKVIFD